MKLVIQIPCLNEEVTLPTTLADLPRELPGVDAIEWLVIDDGSHDRTSEVARAQGVHRVIRFPARRGLARAFEAGLRTALEMGADIIVNTDADNQYKGQDIGKLILPILERRADMVVGTRPIDSIEHFSPLKKYLQKLGSGVVRRLANSDVPDATSGFRAYNREAALRLTVLTNFTYTLETIIQASQKNITVTHVPIRINGNLRESRLFKGMRAYIQRSLGTMFRIYVLYRPLQFFMTLSAACMSLSVLLFVRFAVIWLTTPGQAGHIQSIIVAGALAVIGVLLGALGVLADLIAMNRRLIEEILVNTRTSRLDIAHPPKEGPR
ncbi:MAG: glycosyltransferase family 2 protein [Candidatus Eisenbacteria bacterium]